VFTLQLATPGPGARSAARNSASMSSPR
jgi:hypothetical protein